MAISEQCFKILCMIANLDFYTQYSYQPSGRAEWNTSRNAKFSEKWSPTYSSVRNLLKDVLHQKEVVKEEKARDPGNKKSSPEENKGSSQDEREGGALLGWELCSKPRKPSAQRVARECRAPRRDLSKKNITDYPMCKCTKESYTSARVWGWIYHRN